ncbi:MAG: hypothetical protein CM15mP128_5590 [Methanobacteriota archaeon]|nr:MAG: hypothetical protein CM15mP128_5590 [Euryarchaeota archaeon]
MPDAVGLDEDPEGLVELVRKTMARLVKPTRMEQIRSQPSLLRRPPPFD